MAHRLGELIEIGDPGDDLLNALLREWLKVGDEVVAAGEVGLGLQVEAAMDRLVGALEEAVLAVDGELHAGCLEALVQIRELRGRDDDGRGDVVLGLDLGGGVEVLSDLEGAPGGAGAVEADAEVGADELAVAELQLV